MVTVIEPFKKKFFRVERKPDPYYIWHNTQNERELFKLDGRKQRSLNKRKEVNKGKYAKLSTATRWALACCLKTRKPKIKRRAGATAKGRIKWRGTSQYVG